MLRNPSILSKMKIVMQANYKIFLIVEKMEVNLLKKGLICCKIKFLLVAYNSLIIKICDFLLSMPLKWSNFHNRKLAIDLYLYSLFYAFPRSDWVKCQSAFQITVSHQPSSVVSWKYWGPKFALQFATLSSITLKSTTRPLWCPLTLCVTLKDDKP